MFRSCGSGPVVLECLTLAEAHDLAADTDWMNFACPTRCSGIPSSPGTDLILIADYAWF